MNECRYRQMNVKARCTCKSHLVRFCVVLALTILLWQAPGYADNSVVSRADTEPDQIVDRLPVYSTVQSPELPPMLGDNRLFISGEQRLLFDKSDVVEPVAPHKLPPAKVEAKIIRQPLAAKLVTRRTRVLSLDGLVLRPDGSVDVWINGSLIGKQSNNGIKLVKAGVSGPVVLNALGQRYELYPGQRQVVSLVKKVNP